MNKILMIFRKTYLFLFPSIMDKRAKLWFKANGDETLRLGYESLTSESVVFDLGGYKGQWTSDIYAKYKPVIHVFEPHINYANNIKLRFSKNSDIIVYSFGLSKSDEILNLFLDENGSSLFKKSKGEQVKVELKNINTFIAHNNFEKIDLMKINIEGGEYDVLDALIESTFIEKIDNIQVQFHDFVKDSKLRMSNIHKELSKTHQLTFQYEFIWENWKRKEMK